MTIKYLALRYNWNTYKVEPRYDDIFPLDTICACCGSQYRTMPTKSGNYAPKGLALYEGYVGTAGEHPKNTIAHIETKNGPLTIVSRRSW